RPPGTVGTACAWPHPPNASEPSTEPASCWPVERPLRGGRRRVSTRRGWNDSCSGRRAVALRLRAGIGALVAAIGLVIGTLPAAGSGPLEGIPSLSYVAIIVLENESFDTTWGPSSAAQYLNSLRSSGTLLTQYFGVSHASHANYISLTSGQSP